LVRRSFSTRLWRATLLACIFPVAALGGSVRLAGAQEEPPIPAPAVEHEDIRHVTLDLVVERKDGERWRRATNIEANELSVQLGDLPVTVARFENRCGGAGGSAEPTRYILYFDFAHLRLAGSRLAFAAADRWAREAVGQSDEVMVLTGDAGLRIVRPLLPAGQGLAEDLARARDSFADTEMWAEWEGNAERGRIADVQRSPAMANPYAAMDFRRTRRTLENLRNLMALFDAIEGTKNLVLFEETVRFFPGRVYPGSADLQDVHPYLQALARAANERNVRIYPVDSTGAAEGDEIDDALTMLATETGGQWVERTENLGDVFERIEDDTSCFYRIGFDASSTHSGATERLIVRIENDGIYRVRHRRTVHDTTRDERDAEIVRAALLDPAAADSFPVAVSAMPLFADDQGARVRIQVSVAMGDLLALPAAGPGAEAGQMRVRMGGTVIPLKERAGEEEAPPDPWIWVDAAQEHSPWSFSASSTTELPRSWPADPTADRDIILTEEIDVPPGRYRIVAVVQDQLARTMGSVISDLVVSVFTGALGEIHLAVYEPRAVLMEDSEPRDRESAPDRRQAGEIAAAPPTLPRRALVEADATIPAGRAGHLVFSLCDPKQSALELESDAANGALFSDRQLRRTLVCGGTVVPVSVNPGRILPERSGDACILVIDSLAGALPPGRCRYQVTLEHPDGTREVRVLEFEVKRTPGPEFAGPTGSPTH